MYYEDRDHIILAIIKLIEKKIETKGLVIVDDLWDDELMTEIDELFEAHTDGWRNYN